MRLALQFGNRVAKGSTCSTVKAGFAMGKSLDQAGS